MALAFALLTATGALTVPATAVADAAPSEDEQKAETLSTAALSAIARADFDEALTQVQALEDHVTNDGALYLYERDVPRLRAKIYEARYKAHGDRADLDAVVTQTEAFLALPSSDQFSQSMQTERQLQVEALQKWAREEQARLDAPPPVAAEESGPDETLAPPMDPTAQVEPGTAPPPADEPRVDTVSESPGRPRIIAGAALLGASPIGLVVMAVGLVQADAVVDDYTNLEACDAACQSASEDDLRSKNAIAYVGAAVAGTLAVSGAILLATGMRANRRVTAGVAPQRGGMAIGVSARF